MTTVSSSIMHSASLSHLAPQLSRALEGWRPPRAAEDGFSVRDLQVAVDSESDDQGILGISADVPAGPLSMRVTVRAAAGDGDGAQIRAAIEEAVARCPVHDAVVRAVPVEVVLEMA